MTPHELVYKLIGNKGHVLEITAGDAKDDTWKRAVCSMLQETKWQRTRHEEFAGGAAALAWMDASGVETREAVATLERLDVNEIGHAVVLLEQNPERIGEFVFASASCPLEVEAILTLSFETRQLAAVVLQVETQASASTRRRRALAELALLRYAVDSGETDTARRLGEENRLLRKRVEEARGLEEKLRDRENRITELAEEYEEKARREALLIERVALLERKLKHQADLSKKLKRSFSFRFGHAISLAARSPRDFLLLPYRLARIAGGGFVRRVKRRRKPLSKKQAPAKNVAPRSNGEGLPTTRLDEGQRQLAEFMIGKGPHARPSEFAAILHPLTRTLLGENLHADELHPNTWQAMLSDFPRRGVIVDSHRLLAETPWQHCLTGGSLGYPRHLIELLEYCASNRVPTFLLLHASSIDQLRLSDMAPLFSHVVAPANLDISPLTRSLVGARTRVLRSNWPATTGAPPAFEDINPKDGGLEISDDGSVHEADSSSPGSRLAAAGDEIDIREVFGRPVIIDAVALRVPLRLHELLGKGAVPVWSHDQTDLDLRGYETARLDEPHEGLAARLAMMAARNLLHSAVNDASEKLVADIGKAAGLQSAPFRRLTGIEGLVPVRNATELEIAVNMLAMQSALPAKITCLVNDQFDRDVTKERLQKISTHGIEVVTRSIGESNAAAIAGAISVGNGENRRWCLIDPYGACGTQLFARAAALAATNLAPCFFLGEEDAPCAIVFDSESGQAIFGKTQEPGRLIPTRAELATDRRFLHERDIVTESSMEAGK